MTSLVIKYGTQRFLIFYYFVKKGHMYGTMDTVTRNFIKQSKEIYIVKDFRPMLHRTRNNSSTRIFNMFFFSQIFILEIYMFIFY